MRKRTAGKKNGGRLRRGALFLVTAGALTALLTAGRAPAQETSGGGRSLEDAAGYGDRPSTPLEMALRLEKEQAQGAGALTPFPDLQARLNGGVIPLEGSAKGFPPDFLAGLVPEKINGVEAWCATLRADDASGDILFRNADGKVFWLVAADAAVWSADWIARLRSPDGQAADFFNTGQVLQTLRGKQTRRKMSEDALYRSAWLATRQYYRPSHVEMSFTFILAEDLDAYRAAAAGTATRSPAATPMSMSAPLSGLTVTCFSAGTNAVSLSAAWPAGTSVVGDALDIFFSRTLAPPAWTNLMRVAADPSATGIDVVIPRSEWPPAPEAVPAACVTNIVPSAYDPGILVTNIVYSNAVWQTDSGFFRLADLHDGDSDALTDAFEKWVLKTNPVHADTDGDGMKDGEEVALGTAPQDGDSDDDGMTDGAEVRAIFFENPGWFDVSGGTDLTEAVCGSGRGVTNAALPFATAVAGAEITHASVAANGCVGFSDDGGGLWWGWSDNDDPSSLSYYNRGPLAVAGFWDALSANPDELGSAITLAGVTTNGHRHCVIEYRNMGFSGAGASTNGTVSFQIILTEGVSNRITVLYRDVRGLGDGRSATLGVQGSDWTLLYASNTTNAVHSGLALAYQTGIGTDPLDGDSDDDWLKDGDELVLGTDPLNADTDGDDLSDGDEILSETDPFDEDSDDDGLKDGEEAARGTDPRSPHSDGDGMPDGWEARHGFDPLAVQTDDLHGIHDDPDGDGLPNIGESRLGTSPFAADTDTDGLTDAEEAAEGYGVFEWGLPYSGPDAVPRPQDLTNVVAAAAGLHHAIAVRRDGTVACWGKNDSGQCSPPAGITNAAAVSAGPDQSLAACADGTVVQWGNTFGAVPASATGVVAVAAGGCHSVALRSDGTVVCWGQDTLGLTNAPPSLTNAVAVAAGFLHAAALTADGRVVCWGNAYGGQPEGLTNAVAVAAGAQHTAALTADGRVVCWGINNYGQTNAPASLTNVVAIGAGSRHTLACSASGEVVCWGLNNVGQSGGRVFTNAPVRYLGGGETYSLAAAGARPRWTDPLNGDTDRDGLTDGWEDRYGFDPLADNLADSQPDNDPGADPDADGLTNAREDENGTAPFSGDTDNDQLADSWEILYAGPGIDPLVAGDAAADPDGDMLANLAESLCGTDPAAADTDGDGLDDAAEIGLRNVHPGLDPCLYDSDGDRLPDGWEIQFGLNPCECAAPSNTVVWDADGDGLGLFDEYRYCTSPVTNDTDGDLVFDGVEVPHSPGSCPNDASDGGNPTNCVTLKLTVGDPSGSNSERWTLDVYEQPSGRAVIRHCDDGFGTPGWAEYSLVKGKAYTFEMRWVATDPEYTGTPKPDFDWQAKINDSVEVGAREGLYGTGAFIVEDADALLTEETHGNDENTTLGKEGKIYVPKIVTETVAEQPTNRARKTVGVGEEIILKVLPDSLENVTWTKTNGDGDLEFGESVVFTAPDHEGLTTLAVNCQGMSMPVTFSVIEPDNVVFENNTIVIGFAPPSQDFYSIKYFANVYFLPDKVNFGKIKVCEGYAQTQTDPGYFRDYPPGPHPSWENMPRDVGGAVVVGGKGTKANWTNGDEITGGSEYVSTIPVRNGYAWWEISWKFKVGDGTYKQICPVRQDYRLTGNSTNATFRITKGASGAEISTGDAEAHFINPLQTR